MEEAGMGERARRPLVGGIAEEWLKRDEHRRTDFFSLALWAPRLDRSHRATRACRTRWPARGASHHSASSAEQAALV